MRDPGRGTSPTAGLAEATTSRFAAGIAQGYATLGRIGFEGRFDYAAIGSVTNLASRLCAEAAPWQVLVTRRVHSEAEDVVVSDPVGELTLHGVLPAGAARSTSGGSTRRG